MRRRGLARTLPLIAGLAAVALGCRPAPPSTEGAPPDAPAGPAAAVLDGTTITLAELDEQIRESLFERATEGGDPTKLYELRKSALEELIEERLVAGEAAQRGVEPDALLVQIVDEAPPVDDAAVRAFFDENASRLEGYEFEEVEPAIRARLDAQRSATASAAFLGALRATAELEVFIEAPRVEIEARGPAQGPADAAVTIVEFSDYQCPFCKRAEPTLTEVMKRYPDDVKVVYRHFPLDSIHPDARPASEAAACADEQGKFWPYHAQLFEKSPDLGSESLHAIAEEVGLDLPAFETCVSERRFQELVQQDLDAGAEAGVNGTPAFFVNGILLSGARSVDDFVEIIEAELAPQT